MAGKYPITKLRGTFLPVVMGPLRKQGVIVPPAATASSTRDLEVVLFNANNVTLATGAAGDICLDFACVIVQWTLLADASGSLVIDIWKDTYANFPPTVADTITASAKPTLSSATHNQSSTLTGWTTNVTAGDVLRFNIDSVSGIKRATLALKLIQESP